MRSMFAVGMPAYRQLRTADLDALEQALQKKKSLLAALHAEGCRLFTGTDTQQPFSIPGHSLHRELELFVAAGISPATALRIATRDAAQALGMNQNGRIATGMHADMLLLDRNPAMDIAHMNSLRHVIVRGAIHDVEVLRHATDYELQRRERFFARISSHVLSRLALRRAARHFRG